jgi:DNA-binding MarR family transcriptional regulator
MAIHRTRAGQRATDVILATFRANGRLLAAGDTLAGPDGLTSSRWQVLGAMALAGNALTVPQISRRMGLTRQSVHATVTRLVADGLVELRPNADHRRSQLVWLTERGEAIARSLDERQTAWVNRLAAGLSIADLDATVRVLDAISSWLEAADADPEPRRGSKT